MKRVMCGVVACVLVIADGAAAKERNVWQVPQGSVCEDAIQEHYESLRLVDSAVIQVRAERQADGVHFAPVEGTPYYYEMVKGLRWWPVLTGKAALLDGVLRASRVNGLWMEVTGFNSGDGSLGTAKSPFAVQVFAAAGGRCLPLLSGEKDMVLPPGTFPPALLGW